MRTGTRAQALRSPRGADPGGQGAGGEAGPLVRAAVRLRVSGRSTAGLVLGVPRVQGTQVGGHPPAARHGAGVVVA
ncbi:hypothetical protein ACFY7C_36295 [Streptomyces sp. NPDC012769]|uniref:hypothetical protein n=1 Tax=Streptomyces sp. NPDC012769 TaxID=3364848 RepID=UPI0036C694F6